MSSGAPSSVVFRVVYCVFSAIRHGVVVFTVVVFAESREMLRIVMTELVLHERVKGRVVSFHVGIREIRKQDSTVIRGGNLKPITLN